MRDFDQVHQYILDNSPTPVHFFDTDDQTRTYENEFGTVAFHIDTEIEDVEVIYNFAVLRIPPMDGDEEEYEEWQRVYRKMIADL